MKKKISFLIVPVIIFIILFATAATCNFCGVPIKIGSSEESSTSSEAESEEVTKTTEGKETTSSGQQTQEADSQQDNNSSPVIEKIEIAGMDVETADSAGYFDELPSAVSEGSEMIIVVYASDKNGDEIKYKSYDSLGTDFNIAVIDNNKAEVTWEVPMVIGGYTLTIEVSDGKGGQDSYSVDMNFFVPVEPADAEEINEISISTVNNETGYIAVDASNVSTGVVYVGDGNDPDKYYNAYLSFDISSLTGKEIVSSNLVMNIQSEHGNRSYLGNLRIGILDYGTGALSEADGNIPAEMIIQFPNSTTNINYSGNNLREKLQEKINAGASRLQLKIYWSHPSTNLDDTPDGLLYNVETIRLLVRYTD